VLNLQITFVNPNLHVVVVDIEVLGALIVVVAVELDGLDVAVNAVKQKIR
jgi:hypothetical protein